MIQSNKLYAYLSIAWQKRYLIIIITLFAVSAFVCIYYTSTKVYIFKSNIIIKDYSNPVTNDRRNQNQWTPQLVNKFLHSRPILERIANESGFITYDLPRLAKEARLAYLHHSLTAGVKDGTLITITYSNTEKEGMIKVLEAASQIFINNHNSIFSNFGVDFNQAKTILSNIDSNIASKQAELASLSTRYTKDHSSIQKITKELQSLIKERVRVSPIEGSFKKESPKQSQINPNNNLNNMKKGEKIEQFRIAKLIKIGIIPKMPLSSEPLFIIFYLLGGIAVGLGLSVGIVLLEGLINSSLKGKDELEKVTEIPVLSRIPLV